MSENKNYTPKKVLYNPTLGSIFILLLIIALILLMIKSDIARNLLIQSTGKVNQLISK